MVEKVKITRAQADAIYQIRNMSFYKDDEKLIRMHVENPIEWTDLLEPLNNMQLLDLIDALRVGYEVDSYSDWEDIEKGDVLIRHPFVRNVAIYDKEIDDETISVITSKGLHRWSKSESELYAKRVGETNA